VLADHRQEVAEQNPVLGSQPLGDLVDGRGRDRGGLVGADACVATAIERRAVAVSRVL